MVFYFNYLYLTNHEVNIITKYGENFLKFKYGKGRTDIEDINKRTEARQNSNEAHKKFQIRFDCETQKDYTDMEHYILKKLRNNDKFECLQNKSGKESEFFILKEKIKKDDIQKFWYELQTLVIKYKYEYRLLEDKNNEENDEEEDEEDEEEEENNQEKKWIDYKKFDCKKYSLTKAKIEANFDNKKYSQFKTLLKKIIYLNIDNDESINNIMSKTTNIVRESKYNQIIEEKKKNNQKINFRNIENTNLYIRDIDNKTCFKVFKILIDEFKITNISLKFKLA